MIDTGDPGPEKTMTVDEVRTARAATPWMARIAIPGLGCLLAACQADLDADRVQRVVLITCDTLRADRLGVYGFEHDTSPALDAFARESVVFERAYAGAPMTLPSVCSMLTGQLPVQIGVVHNRSYLHADAKTLAEELTLQGIATAAVVSNWVLINPPTMPPEFGVRQGFEYFDGELPTVERVRKMPERGARDTTNAAISWLEGQATDGAERFFLWVHYQDPHGPYTAPERFADMMQRPVPDEPRLPYNDDSTGQGGIPRYQRVEGERRPEPYRMRYDAEIRYFDHHLGRLFDFIAQRGLLDEALVIVSADHGESLGENDYWFCHGETLGHELVHVPLIVREPGGRAGRVTRLVSQLDLWPTVLEAFGVDPGDCAGSSLLGAGLDRSDPVPERVAVQMFVPHDGGDPLASVMDADYRLHLRNGQPDGLFDRRKDPAERIDILDTQPAVAQRLLDRYRELLEGGPASILQNSTRTLSAEEERILRGLGYGGADDD